MLNWVAAPRDSKGFEPHNRLLAALSGRDLQSLQPHIEAVPLARGSVLFEVGEPLPRVCFVESGVVSLLTAFYNQVAVGVVATAASNCWLAPWTDLGADPDQGDAGAIFSPVGCCGGRARRLQQVDSGARGNAPQPVGNQSYSG